MAVAVCPKCNSVVEPVLVHREASPDVPAGVFRQCPKCGTLLGREPITVAVAGEV